MARTHLRRVRVLFEVASSKVYVYPFEVASSKVYVYPLEDATSKEYTYTFEVATSKGYAYPFEVASSKGYVYPFEVASSKVYTYTFGVAHLANILSNSYRPVADLFWKMQLMKNARTHPSITPPFNHPQPDLST